jgi:AcrR family transcriptional regulator
MTSTSRPAETQPDRNLTTAAHASIADIPRGADGNALTGKGQRTLKRVMDAGRRVLEERGYYEATVVEITERSEIALGTFYRYFDNKEALFLRLLEDLLAELNESSSLDWEHHDVLVNLRHTSRNYLTIYYRNRHLVAALLQMAGAVEECARLWWELRTDVYARMERYIRTTPLATITSPKLTASALGGMTEQLAYHWFVEAERHGKRMPSIEDAAETVAVLWYRAVYQ